MSHFPKIPLPLYLCVLLFVGCKWVFLHSPYYTFKVVKYRGKALKKETGLSLWQQYWQVLSVSIGHGLAPANWYLYKMHQKEQRQNLWNHIYDQETTAFHYHRNHQRPKNKEHVTLLGDKWEFEKLLLRHNIISTNTLKLIPKSSCNFRDQLETLAATHGQIFCKRRTGNQGRGAFSVFFRNGRIHIKPRGEETLPEATIVDFLQTNIKNHDYLIQKDYKHHQHFRTSRDGLARPAIVLRIISRIERDNIHLEFAVLHWPVKKEGKVLFYYPIAINPTTGMPDTAYPLWPRNDLDDDAQQKLQSFLAALSGKQLPFWPQAIDSLRNAHLLLAGVDQIAWDFILGEKRAILLEGNSGWGGLSVCQWFGYDVKRYM